MKFSINAFQMVWILNSQKFLQLYRNSIFKDFQMGWDWNFEKYTRVNLLLSETHRFVNEVLDKMVGWRLYTKSCTYVQLGISWIFSVFARVIQKRIWKMTVKTKQKSSWCGWPILKLCRCPRTSNDRNWWGGGSLLQ